MAIKADVKASRGGRLRRVIPVKSTEYAERN